mmetsp:Transcript_60610/g.98151  ORF Transcript_60610/g.98151 Transcript_60610/m.98151 type:complete len:293 (+) Transcript_60610:392-1270(+)
MRAASWSDAADVLDIKASSLVLPPLIRKLEDEAAGANPAVPNGAVLHDLLRQNLGRMCLCIFVDRVLCGIIRIGAVLTDEHRLAATLSPSLEQGPKREFVVVVNAPDVDATEPIDDVLRRHLPIDRGDRMGGVVLLDELRSLLEFGRAVPQAHALILAVALVVIPLIAHHPHQDGWVMLDRINLMTQGVERTCAVGINRVEHLDPILPEDVKHGCVINDFVSPDHVDASLGHQSGVLLDVLQESDPCRMCQAQVYRVPVDALHVQGLAIYVDPPVARTNHGWKSPSRNTQHR